MVTVYNRNSVKTNTMKHHINIIKRVFLGVKLYKLATFVLKLVFEICLTALNYDQIYYLLYVALIFSTAKQVLIV